jgi:multidrug transporter EmrE-like cation transporter
MYFILVLISFLKTFNPYFRKHIIDSLESHEYLFLNTFLISLGVFTYFLYKLIVHDHSLNKLLDKVYNLSTLQLVYFMLIAFITLVSSIVIINLDKYYNTPLLNSLLTKGIASVLLILTGVFIYKEKYNYKQLSGIFLIIVGLLLINCK